MTETNLRNGSIVPNVAFVWENVSNIAELALLHILLYWVQEVFCSDLKRNDFTFTFYLTGVILSRTCMFEGPIKKI